MKPNNTNKHASSGTPIHHMSIEPLPSADAIAATTIDPVNENIRQLTSAANTIVSIDIEETDPIVDKVKHIKKNSIQTSLYVLIISSSGTSYYPLRHRSTFWNISNILVSPTAHHTTNKQPSQRRLFRIHNKFIFYFFKHRQDPLKISPSM
ncbi:MAG: hypothetical protein WAQ22_01000 [Candidatus Saccharimonas sp.]